MVFCFLFVRKCRFRKFKKVILVKKCHLDGFRVSRLIYIISFEQKNVEQLLTKSFGQKIKKSMENHVVVCLLPKINLKSFRPSGSCQYLLPQYGGFGGGGGWHHVCPVTHRWDDNCVRTGQHPHKTHVMCDRMQAWYTACGQCVVCRRGIRHVANVSYAGVVYGMWPMCRMQAWYMACGQCVVCRRGIRHVANLHTTTVYLKPHCLEVSLMKKFSFDFFQSLSFILSQKIMVGASRISFFFF